MDPNTFETPPLQEPQLQPQPKSRKKWVIIGSILAVLLIGAAVAAALFFLLPKNTKESETTKPAADLPKEFKIASTGSAKTYAGNKVYDACSFISFDTIRSVVGGYQNILNLAGGTTRAEDPLVIEHRYVDRDIPTVLGKDGQPRSKSLNVGGGKEDIGNYLSTDDSNCWYGQGEDIATGGKGITFAKVFVSQLPTPLSPEFKAFVGKLPKQASADGVDIYLEQGLDAGGFAGIVFVNQSKNLAVLLKVGQQALVEPMMKDVAKVLTDGPAGPVEINYPAPWHGLKNPCTLLTADDFEQFTGKKAQALAQERATLTELDDTFMERQCYRVEADNSALPIQTTTVVHRFARVENNAKLYVENLRNDKDPLIKVEAVSQPIEGVDEAYVLTKSLFGEVRSYELEVRSGANVITVNVPNEAGLDASAAVYAERVLPMMNSVLKRWRE
jgi:hypothetical protein